MAEQLLD